MKKFKLQKSIIIDAPREIVWEVLTRNEYFAEWSSVFAEGPKLRAEWDVGGTVYYLDKDNNGLMGKVTQLEPGKLLTVEYEGEVFDHTEDPAALKQRVDWKGCMETYMLMEKKGKTVFDLECELPTKDLRDEFEKTWDKALIIIKGLAEKQKAGVEW